MRGERQLLGAAAVLALFLLVVLLVPGGHRAPGSGDAEGVDLGLAWDLDPERDLTDRGWRLDAEGRPPAAVDGMRLVESVDLSFREAEGEVSLGSGWRSGGTRYAVLWCDLPRVEDPVIVEPTLRLSLAQDSVRLPCAGRDGYPPVRGLQPLPPVAENEHALAQHAWEGDLPSSGQGTLGIYLELYGAPLRTGRPQPLPDGLTGTGVDSGTAPRAGADRERYLASVQLGADSVLELWAGDPGLLTVDVDGVVVTDDGDLGAEEPAWHEQDPELRDGSWHVSTPGAQRRLALPDSLLPEAGGSRTVTLSVPSTRTLPRTWSVRAVPALAAPDPPPPAPLPPPVTLPEAPSLLPLASWQVPRDGLPHELHVPAGARVPTSPEDWVVAIVDPARRTGAEGAPTAHPLRGIATLGERFRDLPVLTGRDGTTGLPSSARIDMLPAPAWRGAEQTDAGADTDQLVRVVVAPAPGHPPATVLAWVPREDA